MPSTPSAPWRARRLLLQQTLGSALGILLSACGGGGGSAGAPGSGGTGFASGPISGFGSIIVNKIRYDDRAAELRDDDGQLVSRAGEDPLQLGVIVDVEGRVAADGLSGTADRLVFRAEVLGLVDSVDVAGASLSVLGRSVKLKRSTVLAGLAGIADLAAGEIVAVYGLPDEGDAIVATRLVRLADRAASYTGDFRLRGLLSELSGSGSNRRFRVAGLPVASDAGTVVSGTLAEGVRVSLRLAKTPVDGRYRALQVSVKSTGFGTATLPRAEIEGFITRFDSLAAFEVNGYPVRTDASTVFEDGSAGVRLGARVEVEGRVIGGVLEARKVEIETQDDNADDNDSSNDDDDARFEFAGLASAVTGDAVNGRFIVRGQRVVYDSRTRFEDGLSPATLSGQQVDVRAAADGVEDGVTRYRAVRIKRDD